MVDEDEAGEHVWNIVAAPVSGDVVQAHTITGGVHYHHHAAPSERPVPRQLPAAPGVFVGRTAELAELSATLDQSAGETVVISAIAGAGGIGKTWLALRWANTQVDRFPDGQLFVDLHGFSPAGAPLPPEVAMRGFLDALGVAAKDIPKDLDAQAALYRSLVAGRRMLIVLDNAATLDQIVPLLPGGDRCTVLVTSRARQTGLITRYGARPLRLDVFAPEDAYALLVRRLGAARVEAEPEAVAELLGWCRGGPLALGILAARAQAAPALRLATLAVELRELGVVEALADDSDPVASLPAVLAGSYRALTAGQREAFGLLALAPGPGLSLPAAASLIGAPPAQAERMLRALEEASLLDRDSEGRYFMHDLIRAYAVTTAERDLPEDVRSAALRRVVDFYLSAARDARRTMNGRGQPRPEHGPRPGFLEAVTWLRTEHANLLAAQRIAGVHGWYRLVWELAETLDTFNTTRVRHGDRVVMWLAALDAAAHLPEPVTGRIEAHWRLGQAYSRLKNLDELTGHLRNALELAESHQLFDEAVHTHWLFHVHCGQNGADRQAYEHAVRALEMWRTRDNPLEETAALRNAARYADRIGEYDSARTHALAGLALARGHELPHEEAEILNGLAAIDDHTGRHKQAVGHYRRVLGLYRTLEHTGYRVPDVLDNLGHQYAALGQLRKARTAWREAFELYRKRGADDKARRVRRQLDTIED